MRYQHNTSHSGFSNVAEIAEGMGLRSPQPQQLALDFAPAQVRAHGLRDAHTHPLVARRKGASFRVPASRAWGFASLELRAGNSWPLMGFDCDVPEKVLDALYANHLGRPRPDAPRLPQPNMIVQRRSNEMRDSMNWSIGKRRFWLNSRIASFWLARSCERVETRR